MGTGQESLKTQQGQSTEDTLASLPFLGYGLVGAQMTVGRA